MPVSFPTRSRLGRQPDYAVGSGHRAALRLLNRDDPPTAIVAASDSLAIGTIRAARELGLSIPEELALVGNDNIASAGDTAPPLTTSWLRPQSWEVAPSACWNSSSHGNPSNMQPSLLALAW